MKIVMTKEFRRKLVVTLNLIRTILVSAGFIATFIFGTGVDDLTLGSTCMKLVAVSLGAVYIGMMIEIFTIKHLIKPGEYMETLFDFGFYGLKSKKNHDEYIKSLKRRKNKIYTLESESESNEKVTSIYKRRGA